MERHKGTLGWKCVLSPGEVEISRGDMVLSKYVDEWKSQTDGTATLTVRPWSLNAWRTMEMFIEGLGEYGCGTVNVIKKGGVEVRQVEY